MLNNFIVFEGLDGSGKSSIIHELKSQLSKEHYKILTTYEPDDDFHNAILGHRKFNNESEMLLYSASRNEHLRNEIVPEKDNFDLIISDRFIDSSLAYQSQEQLPMQYILQVNNHFIKQLNAWPIMTFFIDVPPKECLDRIYTKRQNKIDRLDRQPISYYYQVYQNYKQALKLTQNDTRNMIINGSHRSITEIATQIKNILKSHHILK